MPNDKPLTSNTSLINFTSDYEYVLGDMRGKLLQFSGNFAKSDFLKDQVIQIAYDLETTAKLFAENQGLAPGEIGYDGRPNTGRLYNGIKADVVSKGSAWSARLRSTAKNERGSYYGGHVEFGHLAGRSYVPARPHLRPALQAVSAASRNKLGSFLTDYFKGVINDSLSFSFRKGAGPTADFGRSYGGGPKYYRQGPGRTAQYLSTGTRGRKMQYNKYNIERISTRAMDRVQGSHSVIRGVRNSASQQMGWVGAGRSISPRASNQIKSAQKSYKSIGARRQSKSFRQYKQGRISSARSKMNAIKRREANKRAINSLRAKESKRAERASRFKKEKKITDRIKNEAKTRYPQYLKYRK